jgi:hypothetical protein
MDRLGRLFSAEVSAIIPKVYLHFQKAKHVVTDERKAIEAILTATPSRLHQVESPLALFDKGGVSTVPLGLLMMSMATWNPRRAGAMW